MQAEYSQKKNRIKLRVTTSTGLNLLCTAIRTHKIKELLPHIIKLYEEVKEDQGIKEEDGVKTRPYIKYIRKDEFLIAPSELVGDIFDDNDQVFCEIGSQVYTEAAKKESKKEKKQKQQARQQQTEGNDQIIVPKTKKIKKKNPKKDEKKTQQNGGKEETGKSTHSEHKQTENNITEEKHENGKHEANKTLEATKQPVQLKSGEESKSKKKKNKNKLNTNTPQQTQQSTENYQPKAPVKTSSNQLTPSKQPSHPNQIQKQKSVPKKTIQPTESKPSGTSMLSSDELNKFKEMMKKASSSSA